MFTHTNENRQYPPLRPPMNQSHSENSASNLNSPNSGRRRTSSLVFNSNFFSNLTSSLRNSSSSSNIPSQLSCSNNHQHALNNCASRSRASSQSRLNTRQNAYSSSNHVSSRLSRNNSIPNIHQQSSHSNNNNANTNNNNIANLSSSSSSNNNSNNFNSNNSNNNGSNGSNGSSGNGNGNGSASASASGTSSSGSNSHSNNNNNNNINATNNTNNGSNANNLAEINRLDLAPATPTYIDSFQDQTRSNSLNGAAQSSPPKVTQKLDSDGTYSVRLTPFIDHSSNSSGLYFSPVLRKIKPDSRLSIGRYTDKVREHAQAPPGSSAPVVFKSKVVSRTHAEFHVDEFGNWFVKDLKSSSGTFLNHIRLSPAGVESSEISINNGDVLQLGMDFRGGVEDIFRCVKMRVEMNKSWQRKTSHFDKVAHQNFKALTLMEGSEMSECAICLMKVKPCQPVFISPCSHSWHYKCIRPIVVKSYPQFLCPNCRETCDLEADDDESQLGSSDDDENEMLDGESQLSQLKRSDYESNLIIEEVAEESYVQ